MKNMIVKTFAAAAIAAAAFASPASAIPPPDRVEKCNGGLYQKHIWNMLYGVPNNAMYYSFPNWLTGTGQGKYVRTVLTKAEYLDACPTGRFGHLQAQEAVAVNRDVIAQPTPSGPLKPNVSVAREGKAQKARKMQLAPRR